MAPVDSSGWTPACMALVASFTGLFTCNGNTTIHVIAKKRLVEVQ